MDSRLDRPAATPSPQPDPFHGQFFAPPKRQRGVSRLSLGHESHRQSGPDGGRASGQLHLRSPYPGAVVWIGGRPVGTVPMIWESGIPGEECLVEYRMPGFAPVGFRVIFPQPGETVVCERSLAPADAVKEVRDDTRFSTLDAVREALHRMFLEVHMPVEIQIELLDQVKRQSRGSQEIELPLLLKLYEEVVKDWADDDYDSISDIPRYSPGSASGLQRSYQAEPYDSELEHHLMNSDLRGLSPSPARAASRDAETQTPDAVRTQKVHVDLELVCEDLRGDSPERPRPRRRSRPRSRSHPHPQPSPLEGLPECYVPEGYVPPCLPTPAPPYPYDMAPSPSLSLPRLRHPVMPPAYDGLPHPVVQASPCETQLSVSSTCTLRTTPPATHVGPQAQGCRAASWSPTCPPGGAVPWGYYPDSGCATMPALQSYSPFFSLAPTLHFQAHTPDHPQFQPRYSSPAPCLPPAVPQAPLPPFATPPRDPTAAPPFLRHVTPMYSVGEQTPAWDPPMAGGMLWSRSSLAGYATPPSQHFAPLPSPHPHVPSWWSSPGSSALCSDFTPAPYPYPC